MKLYNLQRLTALCRESSLTNPSEKEAADAATHLRQDLARMDRNQANGEERYRRLPMRVLERGGLYASGIGFAHCAPCDPAGLDYDPADTWCENHDLRRELAALSERDYAILFLRADRYTYDEIAALLDLSPSHVYEVYQKLRRQLMVRLSD